MLLTFLQLYSFSLVDVFLVLFIVPFGILLPFPAGINALFSHGPRRSAGLARIYAMWNVTSLVNVVSCKISISLLAMLAFFFPPLLLRAYKLDVCFCSTTHWILVFLCLKDSSFFLSFSIVYLFFSFLAEMNEKFSDLLYQVVAFLCGYVHYRTQSSSKKHPSFPPWSSM